MATGARATATNQARTTMASDDETALEISRRIKNSAQRRHEWNCICVGCDESVIANVIASALASARAEGRREGYEIGFGQGWDDGADHQNLPWKWPDFDEALKDALEEYDRIRALPIATQATAPCPTCNGTRVMRKMAGLVECNDCTDAREETESQEPGCQGAYCWDGSCDKCMAVPEADWAAWKRGSEETSKP
jgi:hypothetical protein